MSSAYVAPIILMITCLISKLVEGVEKRIAGITSLYTFLNSECNDFIGSDTYLITMRQVFLEEVEELLAGAQRHECCVPTKGRVPKTSGGRQATIYNIREE
jgi:hypothetical protein